MQVAVILVIRHVNTAKRVAEKSSSPPGGGGGGGR